MPSTILKADIANDIVPLRKRGITIYQARALERIFKWVAAQGGAVEWIEGVFYNPETDEGQLSLSYMCQRGGSEPDRFRSLCLDLAADMEAEASIIGKTAYFEIGISNDAACYPA